MGEIVQHKIDVVFVDSLARAMIGDENSVKDVRKIHCLYSELSIEPRKIFADL